MMCTAPIDSTQLLALFAIESVVCALRCTCMHAVEGDSVGFALKSATEAADCVPAG
jgi:hypothetical protein